MLRSGASYCRPMLPITLQGSPSMVIGAASLFSSKYVAWSLCSNCTASRRNGCCRASMIVMLSHVSIQFRGSGHGNRIPVLQLAEQHSAMSQLAYFRANSEVARPRACGRSSQLLIFSLIPAITIALPIKPLCGSTHSGRLRPTAA